MINKPLDNGTCTLHVTPTAHYMIWHDPILEEIAIAFDVNIETSEILLMKDLDWHMINTNLNFDEYQSSLEEEMLNQLRLICMICSRFSFYSN